MLTVGESPIPLFRATDTPHGELYLVYSLQSKGSIQKKNVLHVSKQSPGQARPLTCSHSGGKSGTRSLEEPTVLKCVTPEDQIFKWP